MQMQQLFMIFLYGPVNYRYAIFVLISTTSFLRLHVDVLNFTKF